MVEGFRPILNGGVDFVCLNECTAQEAIHSLGHMIGLTYREYSVFGAGKEREMSNCESLANRFEKMAKNDGLLDVKFYVAGRELVTEQVCREVNRLYEALER